jgi:hypothetical protein
VGPHRRKQRVQTAQSVHIKHAVVKRIVINGDTPVHRNRLFLWMERQQRTPHAKPVPVASGDRRAIPGKPANPKPIYLTEQPRPTPHLLHVKRVSIQALRQTPNVIRGKLVNPGPTKLTEQP